jgi:hypothetical protein
MTLKALEGGLGTPEIQEARLKSWDQTVFSPSTSVLGQGEE